VTDEVEPLDPLDPDSGDEPADSEGVVVCPYCGATNEIGLDPDGGAFQDYVEDCQVCCRPWHVRVTYSPGGVAEITVEAMD
jgi:transposase-like protein